MSKKTQRLGSGTHKARTEEKVKVITELRRKYPLEELLRFFAVPRSTYYYYLKQSKQQDKYFVEKQEISEIFKMNKARYGYRRILVVLRQKGYIINHKTVLKLMKSLSLQAKQRKSKYKSYKGEVGKVADNLLKRNFIAEKPFEKLTTDVTEFSVCNEKVYLSPIMDLYNREILSYSISKSPNFWQTREMLQGLFEKLPKGAKPLLHSDQGWQYQMREFQCLLAEHNIRQSMSRKGNCLDNSSMENFFGRLKTEMFYGETFQSTDEFIRALEEYLWYYNNERISLKLKGMSPVQYRTHSQI